MVCRYSTDLDFDGRRTSIDLTRPIRAGTAAASLEVEALTTKKNTDTTRRHMLHYSQQAGTPLKIEVSYRQANRIREEDITTVDGICVYRINKLATLKIDALVNRVGARDIFDAGFLLHRYPDHIRNHDLLAHRPDHRHPRHGRLWDLMMLDPITQRYDYQAIIVKRLTTSSSCDDSAGCRGLGRC